MKFTNYYRISTHTHSSKMTWNYCANLNLKIRVRARKWKLQPLIKCLPSWKIFRKRGLRNNSLPWENSLVFITVSMVYRCYSCNSCNELLNYIVLPEFISLVTIYSFFHTFIIFLFLFPVLRVPDYYLALLRKLLR